MCHCDVPSHPFLSSLLSQDDLLPAADRIKYHVDKEGQKVIDKDALSKWMEEAAMASQIGNDYIPFVKETKVGVVVWVLNCLIKNGADSDINLF